MNLNALRAAARRMARSLNDNDINTIMTTRPYIIRDKQAPGAQPRLVRATNPAQALRHVTRDRFSVEAAGASDVLDLVEAGVKAETAGAEADVEVQEGGQS